MTVFKWYPLIVFGMVGVSGVPILGQLREFRDVRMKMGSRFELTLVAEDEGRSRSAIEAAYREIDRIEALISSWKPESQTSRINRMSGVEPVTVDRELFDLIQRANKVSKWTGGCFDITYATLDGLWDFNAPEPSVPLAQDIKGRLDLIGYEKMVLDGIKNTVYLPRQGMKIGFGAIGKGFVANRIAHFLKARGFEHAMIDAGGDLYAMGTDASLKPWRVGIVQPGLSDSVVMELRLSDKAVVTSGNYERYFELDGLRYAHILDPRTGWPVVGLASATVICPDAELADALATAVFVMGAEKGIQLIDRFKHIEAVLIDNRNQAFHSKGIQTLLVEESTP